MCYVLVNNMYIFEVIPLFAIQRGQNKVLSFYYPENLPAGSVVEVLVRSKKTKAVVINSQSLKLLKIRLKKEVRFELKPILRVLEKKEASEPFDIALLFPPKKTLPEKRPRTIASGELRGRESGREILQNYIKILVERKIVSTAKSYMQETAEKYLQYIDWENDSFEEDMRLFWVSASNYYRSHTHHDFIRLLEWIKKKDNLSPKQVAKLFNKE